MLVRSEGRLCHHLAWFLRTLNLAGEDAIQHRWLCSDPSKVWVAQATLPDERYLLLPPTLLDDEIK